MCTRFIIFPGPGIFLSGGLASKGYFYRHPGISASEIAGQKQSADSSDEIK